MKREQRKNSWARFVRNAAAALAMSGAMACLPVTCYAVQLAYDDATKPAYADGWQGTTTNNFTGVQSPLGDNGGMGFSPWDFDTD